MGNDDMWMDVCWNTNNKIFYRSIGRVETTMNKIIQEDLDYIINSDIEWELLRNKTVLITGAFGFVASYMTRTLAYLNQKFNMNIRIFSLTRKMIHHPLWLIPCDGLHPVQHDVRDPIIDWPSKNSIDYIIHAASQATPKVFGTDPVGTLLPNVVGTYNMLELAKHKNLKKFLFISTTGVLGFQTENNYPLRETDWGVLDPTQVANCYLESKRMGENMCMAYNHQYNIPIQIARLGGCYGPGLKLDDGRVFADFISNIVKKEDIVVYSDGLAKRDYLYVADATIAFFKILLTQKNGKVYNVSSSTEISIIELAELLACKVFPELGLKVVLKKDSNKDFMRVNFSRSLMDNSLLKHNLGWKEKIGLVEGFRRTAESYYE